MRNWKIYLVLFLFFAFSGLIIYRLYDLQIRKGDHYEVLALGQNKSLVENVGNRGEIFFSDKIKKLATNKEIDIIYINPSKLEDKEKAAEILKTIGGLNESKEEILKEFGKEKIIKKEIVKEKAEDLKKQNLKGIVSDKIQKRIYPYNSLAASTIGFVNSEGEGQYGIEIFFNNLLKGKKGFEEKEKSPFGYLFSLTDSNKEEPESGDSLILTLDYNIQFFSEKLLKEAKEKWDIDSGQIIVMEPTTGKIMALADFPSFDPNQYQKEKDLSIFLNGAAQKLFEPGSILKPITMAAGLEMGVITPETTYIDPGSIKAGSYVIYNYRQRNYGKKTMAEVLEKSINTGAVFVEKQIGHQKFLEYLDKFGFFEKSGIELREEMSKNINLKEGIEIGIEINFFTASFGQGIAMNAIQLLKAFSAIANSGKIMKPYIVETIIEGNGEIVEIKPKVVREVISSKTSSQLTNMLINVVENGYATRAKIPGYYIAGKTGTAEIPKENGRGYQSDKTIQSFIGFFPALNPKFLILVKLDNPKEVGTAEYSAAPLFGKLAKELINLYQVPPDYQPEEMAK